MSEQNETQNQGEQTQGGEDSPVIKELRAKANAADAAAERAAKAEKRLAFLEAGIVPKEGDISQLVFDTYQGEATTEAVIAFAEKYGIKPGGGETPPTNDGPTTRDGQPIPVEEQEAHAQRRTLEGAGTDGGNHTPDPYQAAASEYERELSQGTPREKASSAYVGTILRAVHEGNTRPVYDRTRYFQEKGWA